MKRQDFLVKINTLNQKIESLDKKGVYSMNYTLQQRKKDHEMDAKQEKEFKQIQEMQKLLDTRKKFARDLMF